MSTMRNEGAGYSHRKRCEMKKRIIWLVAGALFVLSSVSLATVDLKDLKEDDPRIQTPRITQFGYESTGVILTWGGPENTVKSEVRRIALDGDVTRSLRLEVQTRNMNFENGVARIAYRVNDGEIKALEFAPEAELVPGGRTMNVHLSEKSIAELGRLNPADKVEIFVVSMSGEQVVVPILAEGVIQEWRQIWRF